MKETNLPKKIEVVSYDPDWPKIFAVEKGIISAALGDNCVAIHHIGSTSVPGLASKPKIDIVAVAKDRKMAIVDLGNAGYTHKGEWNIPLKCGFTKRGAANVNLHLFFDENHPEVELNLKFRDYLMTHPAARDEYATLKMKILEKTDAHQKSERSLLPIYTIRKRAFIDDAIKRSGFYRLRVLKCATENEWDAAKNFREKYFDRVAIMDPVFENFDNPNHEHFILYRGVEIIGYADIFIVSESEAKLSVFENLDRGAIPYFLNVIKEWMEVHGCKNICQDF
ncbi:MAG: GrpB family protein [Holosporaceae bacterium]|nr:GrpB family protein [Holosporaceae bacterium]